MTSISLCARSTCGRAGSPDGSKPHVDVKERANSEILGEAFIPERF